MAAVAIKRITCFEGALGTGDHGTDIVIDAELYYLLVLFRGAIVGAHRWPSSRRIA
jgi:hypothetical protein